MRDDRCRKLNNNDRKRCTKDMSINVHIRKQPNKWRFFRSSIHLNCLRNKKLSLFPNAKLLLVNCKRIWLQIFRYIVYNYDDD